jgi:radical SAM superfamily enzyme YgiQ (UPF0313 family)
MAIKKFNITFVYPDFENLGIEYLMALCKKVGHKVALVYCQVENSYLAKKQQTISLKKIVKKIITTNPDIVAFSCVTDNYQYQLKYAKALKKIRKDIITVFGGIHPTAVPKLVLREKAVNAIAIGEADISFIQFLKQCHKDAKLILPEKKVDGIVFKKKGKLIGEFTEGPLVDLDKLPFPYKEPFFASKEDLAQEYRIITSRGCPYNCTYCFNSFIRNMRINKKIIRQRSVENVIKELLWAKKQYNIKNIFFIDDSFTTNKQWITQFTNVYKKKIGLPFACIANPDYIDKIIVKLLKNAGCVFVQIGVQSLCKKISNGILNRAATKEKISQVIKDLKTVKIMVQVDHMLGIPSDTIENQENAVLYYNLYRPDLISVFWLTYYPKTPIIKTALRRGILKTSEVKKIETGQKITKGSIHNGGSLKNPKPFYSIQLLMNYLYFLPKWLVSFLIKTKTYRLLSIKNYHISTAVPRAILAVVDKRYFTGRTLLFTYLKKLFPAKVV